MAHEAFADVRSAIDGAPAPEVRDILTTDRLFSFASVTSDILCQMVNEAVNKFSMKDPMPTWLFKSCINLLAPYITSLFNSSLSSGAFPTCYKDAYVTPRLKKPTVYPLVSFPATDRSRTYRSCGRFWSESSASSRRRAFCRSIHQSAYRRIHSTETALLKVVADITEAINAGDHALCLVCSISLPPSIRWTMMFWRSACRGRTRSARPRLLGFAPISAITDRRSSSMGSSQLSALSAVASLRAPCSGCCCFCFTLPTWVRLLPVSAYHPTSTLMTLTFTRGDLHQQLYSSGVEWSLVLSG